MDADMAGGPAADPDRSGMEDGDEAARPSPGNRLFLVVVDESEEMPAALRFASRRAKRTGGRVGLLYVLEPADFQHWLGVEAIMREEGRQKGEALLQKAAAEVNRATGSYPIYYVREGDRAEALFDLLEEEAGISVVVLAASTGKEGPGPIISNLTSNKGLGRIRIPFTIVPGGMTNAEIDAVT